MRASDEDLLARRMARRLDLGGLSEGQRRRLVDARQQALQCARGGPAHVGDVLRHAGMPALRGALSMALVLGLGLGGSLWRAELELERSGHLERALLVDDLPIDAYLDEGFRAWLESRAGS